MKKTKVELNRIDFDNLVYIGKNVTLELSGDIPVASAGTTIHIDGTVILKNNKE